MAKKKNPAAVALGRIGGKSGTGENKSRSEQLRAYWASPKAAARRKK